MIRLLLVALLSLLAACGLRNVGRAPDFSSTAGSFQHDALYSSPHGLDENRGPTNSASLWTSGSHSLLGDRRAARRGDIVTVVIEIDESAEISNRSDRSRSTSRKMAIPQMLGLPQRINESLPEGASMANAVDTSSSSNFNGNGGVSRSEELTLRIAATVIDVLPNGVLRLEGQQEVRVNYELRELIVTGYVRPNDISRRNEITYDKIAGARISYGGRGQISAMQQPPYGQQISDVLLPY